MEQKVWSSGGVDCSRHPNWIWLPLFYQLPKELLEGKSEYLSLPRCPHDVLHSNNNIDMLNADCFVTFVRTTYAKVVWRFIMVPNKSGSHIGMPCNYSDFSTDFSLWQLAYGASEQMREIMEGSSLSLRCLNDMPSGRKVAWVPLKDYYHMVSEMTAQIVREQNWQPTIDFLWENLTLEDFSDHNSKKKIDAYRKWHHTRTKVGRQMLSYEAMLEQAEDGGYRFDLADTSMEPSQYYDKYIEGPKVDEANEYHGWAADGPYDEWLEKRADIYYKEHSEFLKILKCSGNELSVEDRQVLALRNERFTVSRIAQIMGYKSHAAVTNRLKRVEAYCSNGAATAKATRGSPFYNWRYRCWIRIRGRALMRDLYVTNGFTSCRYCLREDKPAKRDNRCRTYRSGTICAACDHSHIRPSLDEVEQLFCDTLSFKGKHYIIGTGHKEFRHDKIMDEDYYILTLAAIGKELRHRHLTSAEVIIAAGLPLTWADYQHTHFKEYLMKNPHVDFTYLGVDYHVDIKDVFIFSQGVAAIAHRIKKFTGINMLVDIGNGTMNVFNINDKKVIKESFFTEKYGTYQCVILARELLQRHFSSIPMDPQIEKYMCSLHSDMGEKYKTIIGDAAKQYVAEIFRRLREREYDPDLMRLWVTGGGACLVKNFGEFKPDRVIILNDIHANARGYEALAKARLEMGA